MTRLFDPVNSPEHCASGKIECIEAIEAQLTPEEQQHSLHDHPVPRWGHP